MNHYQKYIKWLTYGFIATMPLIFSTSFYTVFSIPKLITLRLFAIIIVLIAGLKVLLNGKINIKPTKFQIFLIFYLFAAIISGIFSFNVITSIFGSSNGYLGLLTLVSLIIFTFSVHNSFKQELEIRRILEINTVAAGLVSLYGISQYFNVGNQMRYWNLNDLDRIFSTLGQANHLAAYLAFSIIFTLALIFKNGFKKYNIIWITILVLEVICLFFTGSRGSLIALIIGLVIYGIIYLRNNRKSVSNFINLKSLSIAFIAIIITALLSFTVFNVQNSLLFQRSFETVNAIKNGIIPDRISFALSSWSMFLSRPITGFGYSTFNDVYNLYRRTDYRTIQNPVMQDIITPESPHNQIINILSTEGLIGIISFLVLIIYVLRLKCQNSEIRWLSNTLKIGLIVLLIQFLFNFEVIATIYLFFLDIALIAAINEKVEHKIVFVGRLKFILAIASIIIATTLTYYTYHEALANYYLKQASVAKANGDFHSLITSYQESVNAAPWDYLIKQSFGDSLISAYSSPDLSDSSKQKMLSLAIINYQSALNINQNHPSIYFNMALAEMTLFKITQNENYYTSSVTHLKKSMEKAVNNPLYFYQSAKLLLGTQKTEATEMAKTALKECVTIRPDYADARQLLEALNK